MKRDAPDVSSDLTDLSWTFICDGDENSGLGHVSRCLGFAESLEDCGLSVRFLGNFSDASSELIRRSGLQLVEARDVNRVKTILEEDNGVQGVCLDSYRLTDDELAMLSSTRGKGPVCWIDDFGTRNSYYCDAVINFTINARKSLYPSDVNLIFAGPEFYPARRWLREERERRQVDCRNKGIENVLIFAGGQDFSGVSERYLHSLLALSNQYCVRVVLPAAASIREEIESILTKFSDGKIVEFGKSFEEQFRWADVCLCGGGLTKYDCGFAGIPVASLAQTQEQQRDTEALLRMGAVWDFGMAELSSARELTNNLERFFDDDSQRMVISQNAQRVIGSDSGDSMNVPFLESAARFCSGL